MAYQDHEDGGRSGHKMSSGNSCQRCSHGDAHYYWHHLDDRKKHFFKVMLGDFQQEMIVPEKFVNNFRGQIAETVKLEAPDGNMYNVQVFKDLNKLVFRSGWGTFCNAYQLKLGDVLVFRYSGDSHFKVLIFDPSGCVAVSEDIPSPENIQDPSNSGLKFQCMSHILTRQLICKDYSDKHLPNEDQTITLCYPPDYEKHDANFKVSPAGAYIFSANWSLFVRDNEVQEGDAFAFEALKIERRVTLTVHPLQGSYQELGASSPNRVVRPAYMVTRKTKLTPEQKKKVEEKLQEIQPATPVFLSVKRHSDASMCFNQGFAMEYLPGTCAFSNRVNEVHRLGRGWKQFVDDNALLHGDMCVFQPLDGGEEEQFAMNVHVIGRG
ncbi:hypothetical protein QOZ80_5AG0396160 [Eleusine coracana subsp. coracana]|nr:hypothetical protein QOZ80_5AG0396160 [Eleusine coracana subsp. coracana]